MIHDGFAIETPHNANSPRVCWDPDMIHGMDFVRPGWRRMHGWVLH